LKKKLNSSIQTLLLNPSRYRILAVGKIKKDWIQKGLNVYLKRLPGLSISEIRDSNPQKEAENIISKLRKDESIIALSEEYTTFSSIKFSEKLCGFGNQRLVFIIGGSNGIGQELKNIAQWKLSLSPLTFPHEIARLLLIEQIYRAQSILSKSPYHRY
tara:strand:- start:37459 stop:37932 length:474 start_codon:yes stop_codon:yes gene_type:complete